MTKIDVKKDRKMEYIDIKLSNRWIDESCRKKKKKERNRRNRKVECERGEDHFIKWFRDLTKKTKKRKKETYFFASIEKQEHIFFNSRRGRPF